MSSFRTNVWREAEEVDEDEFDPLSAEDGTMCPDCLARSWRFEECVCEDEDDDPCHLCDDGGITGDGKLCPLCDAVPGS